MTTIVTKTVKPSGGDVTSLSSFNSTYAKNLVASDEIYQASCFIFSGGLNDQAAVSGFTTDATRFVRVFTQSSERHNGTPNSGFYLKPSSASGAPTLRTGDSYVRYEGMDINGNGKGDTGFGTESSPNTCGIYFGYGLIHDTNLSSSGEGVRVGALQNKVVIYNTAIWNCYRGIYSTGTNNTSYGYNLTAVNNGDFGLLRLVYKNCLSKGHTSGDYLQEGTGSDYNAAGDTSPSVGAHNRNSQTFTFTNSAGFDYSLTSSDAGAQDHGQDLSADSAFAFADDVIGTARPQNSVWDMGFFEVVSGGAGGPAPSAGRRTLLGVGT